MSRGGRSGLIELDVSAGGAICFHLGQPRNDRFLAVESTPVTNDRPVIRRRRRRRSHPRQELFARQWKIPASPAGFLDLLQRDAHRIVLRKAIPRREPVECSWATYRRRAASTTWSSDVPVRLASRRTASSTSSSSLSTAARFGTSQVCQPGPGGVSPARLPAMAHRPRGSCHSRLPTGSSAHDGRDREDARGHNEHPRDGAGRVVELGEGCGDPCERRGEGRDAEGHDTQDRPPDDSKNHERHRPILPDPSAGFPACASATAPGCAGVKEAAAGRTYGLGARPSGPRRAGDRTCLGSRHGCTRRTPLRGLAAQPGGLVLCRRGGVRAALHLPHPTGIAAFSLNRLGRRRAGHGPPHRRAGTVQSPARRSWS